MRELTDDEADTVMANIWPDNRRWCGPIPGDPIRERVLCACTGCVGRAISYEDFIAWEQREALRSPTPYVGGSEPVPPQPLEQRLAEFKAGKK